MKHYRQTGIRRIISVWIAVCLFTFLITACGQSSTNSTLGVQQSAQAGSQEAVSPFEEIASYEGADREQFLLEKAKQEGEINLYTSMSAPDIEHIAKAFTDKYGIKVNIWRSGSVEVRARVVTEAGAGKLNIDMVEAVGPDIEAIHQEGLLQKITSPYHKDLMKEAVPPHQEWVAARINLIVQAYNTNKIKKDDLPKTYEELLDPKWKGQLGIESTDDEWLAPLAMEWGEEKGIQYFKDLVKTNGLTVINGHSLLTQMVGTGEVPIGLTVYSYKVDQMKREGQPIDWFALDPAIALPSGIGITKNAPHPYAAALFYDYMLTEAQPIMLERDMTPTSTSLDTGLQNVPIKFLDSANLLAELDKWMNLYEEIIVRQSTK
ncbi:ABC transporter substrate-binding protein [Paenibacillus abyssi]|uniref:ABC transporter substrate-binding protein n=1 Tax=Paenibacillus abyssi TaxID=1340531 RepID=A0A917CME6_9BACL|nr:extracellular solute-binding protein [Paenibacillus abyssi]GGF90983.1 hypothetical protein GCM10010916_05380 [Paenibacillus abyssi]